MTISQSTSGAQAAATTRRLRSAVEAADLEGYMDALVPDVILKSPLTFRTEFRGHDEIRELMRVVFATVEDIRYFEEVGTESTRALFAFLTRGGRPGRRTARQALISPIPIPRAVCRRP
ncbi:MAG: hypothetical protein GEV03_09155 [Streptosporangiales bacterium]|nr:hypothetical protein [Streptosporangiales bacterium]